MSSPSDATAVTNTSSPLAKNELENTDKTCVVCFKIVDIFSIGECDHPVCYECSTRMRVLCQQNECPICRRINQKVIFTSEILTYRELDLTNRSGLYNKTFRIAFTGQRAMNAFQRLLEHPCSKCGSETFPTAAALKDHLRKVHELFYCDICTENLKIFSFERKAYTRELLALHRRKGDPDNTSHRGHPLCEYCDERYLDRDELFRHLRRDHFYCHFCDLDGTGTNNFYADHQSLREHFIDQHYLCEEGECNTNIFTASFRSDIDLKAHKASVHGQTSRHARTINFDFPRSANNSRGNRYDDSDEYEQTNPLPRTPVIDARNEQDFPSLGNGPSVPLRPNIALNNRVFGTKGLAKTKENFPALGGLNSNVPISSSGPSTSAQETASALLRNTQRAAANKAKNIQTQPSTIKSKPVLNNLTADFPSLPGGLGYPLESNRTVKKTAAAVTKAKALAPVKVVATKKTLFLNRTLSDFPNLSAIAAQNSRKDLESDFIEVTPNFSMAAVSAKHRGLVPSYESINAGQSSSKINTIQRTEVAKTSPISNERTPALNSKASFPALGGSSAAATAPQWLSNNTAKSKKQPQVSKKLKVAPPPLLDHATNEKNLNKQKTEVERPKPDEKLKAKTDKNKENAAEIAKKNSKKDKKNATTAEGETSSKPKEKENVQKLNAKANKTKETNLNKKNEDNQANNNNTNGKEDKVSTKNKRAEHTNELNGPTYGNIFANVTASLPPPGFSGNGQVKPPPGFSSGSQQSTVVHEYIPPSNATQRNQILVSFFQKTLKPEVVEEFRNYSILFRENMCTAETFYEHCELTLGGQFNTVFPELLSLLPDITKQQELFNVYIQRHPNPEVVLLSLLRICEICKQVVKQSDFADHLQLHSKVNLNQNFPKLGINGVTRK